MLLVRNHRPPRWGNCLMEPRHPSWVRCLSSVAVHRPPEHNRPCGCGGTFFCGRVRGIICGRVRGIRCVREHQLPPSSIGAGTGGTPAVRPGRRIEARIDAPKTTARAMQAGRRHVSDDAMTKGGIHARTRSLACTLAERGIRVKPGRRMHRGVENASGEATMMHLRHTFHDRAITLIWLLFSSAAPCCRRIPRGWSSTLTTTRRNPATLKAL